MQSTNDEKRTVMARTIEWINTTFAPVWGLKPIEELPKAIMSDGRSCVIARILKESIPIPEGLEWFVGSHNVSLQKRDGEYDSKEEKEVWEMPEEVSQFISFFDHGLLPDLVELETNQIVIECTLCRATMVCLNDLTPEAGYSSKVIEHFDNEHSRYVDNESERGVDERTGDVLVRVSMKDTFKVIASNDD